MADSNSSLTPEKRLLNLIESGGKAEAPSGTSTSGGSAATSRSPIANGARMAGIPGMLWGGTPFLISWAAFSADWRNRWSLKSLNQTARLVLIGFVLVTAANTFYEWSVSNRDPLEGLNIVEHAVAPVEEAEPDFDAAKIQTAESRNVFLPFAKREEIKAAAPQVGASALKLVEMTKMLKLTGISFDPENETGTYCMIEDLSKNITVFLRKGDRISGLRVEQIREESVELEYEGEKIELR